MRLALLALIFVRLGFGQYTFSGIFCTPSGGTDAYACTLNAILVSYQTGSFYAFKADVANTGAATANFNGLGAKTIVKVGGGVSTALADNDILAGQMVVLQYDGTNMQMQSTLGNATCPTCTVTIASGSKALDFGSTATGACATVITDTATGTASTDVIIFTTNASIKAVTGYVPASTGGFSVNAYPTTNTVNFEGCNWTAGTVDPGSITVNWKVIR